MNIQTATLGMGCFWGPDARFGHLRGVLRTCVGYAGGTTPDPTYRQMGDHTETVEIDFDSEIITFVEILRLFWKHHNPLREVRDHYYEGRQYMSLLFYHNDQQKELAMDSMREWEQALNGELETEILPYTAFYRAEDKHQKYYLKRYPNAIEQLKYIFPSHGELVNSTLAARLNGFVKGYGTLDDIQDEIQQWDLEDNERGSLIEHIRSIRW